MDQKIRDIKNRLLTKSKRSKCFTPTSVKHLDIKNIKLSLVAAGI